MRSMYFDNVDEMNEKMIVNWNNTVGLNDIVYHLGDFGDYDFLKYLNGNIILLEGNYERDKISIPTPKQKEKLCDYVTALSLKSHEHNLTMVHEPSHIRNIEGFYLFGHIHEKQKVKNNGWISNQNKSFGLNVGVDCHNFTPVSIETIKFYREAIENIYDEECFVNF